MFGVIVSKSSVLLMRIARKSRLHKVFCFNPRLTNPNRRDLVELFYFESLILGSKISQLDWKHQLRDDENSQF